MKNMRKITRRDAINYSCMTVAGLSLAGLEPKKLVAQGQPQAQEAWPDTLVERPLRDLAPLPPNPRGIVKWTGVRFADFAEMLGIQPFAHYARIIGADRFWVEEDLRTLLQPQVMLAWLMNGQPMPPKHGAPLRLIIPFRYGARHSNAISEIIFTPTGFPLPTLPG